MNETEDACDEQIETCHPPDSPEFQPDEQTASETETCLEPMRFTVTDGILTAYDWPFASYNSSFASFVELYEFLQTLWHVHHRVMI